MFEGINEVAGNESDDDVDELREERLESCMSIPVPDSQELK